VIIILLVVKPDNRNLLWIKLIFGSTSGYPCIVIG